MQTQTEAKRFFAEKVIAEAERHGAALSEAERAMLYWSESDPDFAADPALVEALAREISDEEYEAKIVRLLDAAYRRDVEADPSLRDQYTHAQALLGQGDHYIGIMVDQALGRPRRPWWKLF